MSRRTFAHLINPVRVPETSDLYIAQPVTFATMRTARAFAADDVNVQLVTVQYAEDRALVPNDFEATTDLERSVLDMGIFQKQRKLPILKDMLDRLYDASDAEWFIYTNVDIGLQPHFYAAVSRLIDEGCDAFVINRRTIADRYQRVEEIPLMYAEVGEAHPGHDCFIFRRDAYPRYELAGVCIGAMFVGRTLIGNLAAHARCYREFKDKHLTFHIGNDQTWQRTDLDDYRAYNGEEFYKAREALERQLGPGIREGAAAEYLFDKVPKVYRDATSSRGAGEDAGRCSLWRRIKRKAGW